MIWINLFLTYINAFDTTVDITVIIFVTIAGSGTATFTVEKNGSVISTQTVDASEVFVRLEFNLTEAVTNTDYFEINVDTGGADVDLGGVSLNITINGVMSLVNFPYQFRFLYKTD
jgi:hypothetical protein